MPKKAGGVASILQAVRTDPSLASPQPIQVAVQGCCHGDLHAIYAACKAHEEKSKTTIGLLICCGDFQSVRNAEDLTQMAVPDHYRTMGDFVDFYEGRAIAPIPTIFIGGNHEASNLLWEQYYGGFVAPNIYYLGHSGVVRFGGLRIAGLSGIYKDRDFDRAYPLPPYDYRTRVEAFHVRRMEVEKMHCVTGKVDICVSHDWPVGVTKYGNEAQLLRCKPRFEEDINRNALGNPYTLALLKMMKPTYWFAAHLHCRFDAKVDYALTPNDQIATDRSQRTLHKRQRFFTPTGSEIVFEKEKNSDSAQGEAPSQQLGVGPHTKFIALDKCIQNRSYLDFFTLTPSTATSGRLRLEHDPEWLDIILATHRAVPIQSSTPHAHCSYEGADLLRDPEFRADGSKWRRFSAEGCSESLPPVSTTTELLTALGLATFIRPTPRTPNFGALEDGNHDGRSHHGQGVAADGGSAATAEVASKEEEETGKEEELDIGWEDDIE